MLSMQATEYWCKLEGSNQGRIKVGAIDAAALGPFLKLAHVTTDKNFVEA